MLCWGVLFLVFGKRLPFDYDSINYALALVDRFNPAWHQPHAPGYILHVMHGKLVHLFISNPFTVAEVQNLVYFLGILVPLAKTAKKPGYIFFATTLPLFLFLSITPSIYAASLGLGGILCLALLELKNRKIHPAVVSALFALAIGFRQDLFMFMAPVVLYGFISYRPSVKAWMLSAAVFTLVCLAWFVPTWLAIGASPLSATGKNMGAAMNGCSIFLGGTVFESARWTIRAAMFLVSAAGIAGLLFMAYGILRTRGEPLLFLLIGIVPNIFFALFICGTSPGYFAVSLGFFIIWAGCFGPSVRPAHYAALALLNLCFFFFVPTPQWAKNEGFEHRPLIKSVEKQLRLCGAYGFKESRSTERVMQQVDASLKNCPCVYGNDTGPVWNRILSYMSRYEWKNRFTDKDPEGCCRADTVLIR